MPAANLLGERGAGFVIAQDRLGPGRIHHCMRAIGTAERAIEMMCERANSREAFGGPLADKQFVQDFIAKSRMEVDQARLLTLYAAWQMDTDGKRQARQEISMIKVVAANVVMDVLDRAIQVHGSLGMSDDTPLAGMWRFSRMLRVADGPDEVHKMVIARRELNRAAKRAEAVRLGEGQRHECAGQRHRRLRGAGQGLELAARAVNFDIHLAARAGRAGFLPTGAFSGAPKRDDPRKVQHPQGSGLPLPWTRSPIAISSASASASIE